MLPVSMKLKNATERKMCMPKHVQDASHATKKYAQDKNIYKKKTCIILKHVQDKNMYKTKTRIKRKHIQDENR